MELPRVGVITIQGGGAVAVDLIGQLQGLTGPQHDPLGNATGDHGLLPAAVAGTSAGAIIATLYWSGYAPEAIRDEVVRLFAPARINAFFGHSGRLGIRFTGFAAFADAFSAFLRGPLPFLWHLAWPGWRRWYLIPVWVPWQIASVSVRGYGTISALLNRRGVFPGDGLVREVDRLLRDSPLLEPHKASLPADGLLRFSDVAALQDPQTIPLFLIVTDLRGADIAVISSINPACGALCIAEAVRASAGFPGFFQPMRLSDRFDTCIDGGVISNFPAWVFGFDYRRSLLASRDPLLMELAYIPWLHIGLRLPADEAPPPHGIDGLLRGLAGLLIGRARTRLEDKLAAIVPKRRSVNPSPAPVGNAPQGVLDFGALSDPAKVNAAFDRGRINGRDAIEPDCLALPETGTIRPILSGLAETAKLLLTPWLVPGSKVRGNIFVPEGDELCLAYHVNMDGDRDEHLRFSHGEGISSFVFRHHATVVADLRSREQSGGAAPTGTDLYLDGEGAPAVEPDRTWLMSMPLVDMSEMWPKLRRVGAAADPFWLDMDGPVLGVVNIDAAIDYTIANAPGPAAAETHPAVLALFEVMKSAALRCSIEFNRRFLE
ncbi:MAG: patatin-like phospholipase family protein [Aliidongia sp.]